jgi:hypothetical protein
MIFQPPPAIKPLFDVRKFPRLELPWTIKGKVVHDYNQEGMGGVTIQALDVVTGMEIARTVTGAKGDYSMEVTAGPSTGYLIRPEYWMYSFMPVHYRVFSSTTVPNFVGHNNK